MDWGELIARLMVCISLAVVMNAIFDIRSEVRAIRKLLDGANREGSVGK